MGDSSINIKINMDFDLYLINIIIKPQTSKPSYTVDYTCKNTLLLKLIIMFRQSLRYIRLRRGIYAVHFGHAKSCYNRDMYGLLYLINQRRAKMTTIHVDQRRHSDTKGVDRLRH